MVAVADADEEDERTATALEAFTSVTIVVPPPHTVLDADALAPAAPPAALDAEAEFESAPLPLPLPHGVALELSATALSFAFGPEQHSSPLLSMRPATDTVTRIGPRRLLHAKRVGNMGSTHTILDGSIGIRVQVVLAIIICVNESEVLGALGNLEFHFINCE